MYYQILQTLKPTTFDDAFFGSHPFVAVIKPEEWQGLQQDFHMGIDMDFNIFSANSTKAEVNLDSLTGTFKVPVRDDLISKAMDFSFALDERGIIFIDCDEHVEQLLKKIQKTKRWKQPSLERFIYDFLEFIIKDDSELLEAFDRELDQIEENVLDGVEENNDHQLNKIRKKLIKLNQHYMQLIDLAQEFSENENNFFKDENLRFFHLFASRVSRLQTTVQTLRETIIQIRDLAQGRLEMKQNKIMAILTIVTTSCMPLTILVGWYGMNFKYMPELSSKWGYPAVILVAITILVSTLTFFKYKRWL
ncbi:CorA family divalent cation transporter [Streptococcus sp. FSL R7-0212]|uniref:magnesium transporter CorA family protein n=1 Tax=Streptococcus sp. FSL R7-0212 TaxID=2921726 RepID=UPI0030F5FAA9